MARKGSWSNPDGLVVGFGLNTPEKGAQTTEADNAPVKGAVIRFDYTQINTAASGSINWAAPAGSTVVAVELVVDQAWVGGTSLEFGDASDTDGFISTTQGATASLTAGAKIVGAGVYTKGGTDTTAQEFKVYASATVCSVLRVGTYTAGSAVLKISYI
jgi:hypothetical protein